MSDALIIRSGMALWGDSWQAPMSRALGVHKDTVQGWRQGRISPRANIYAGLARIAEQRQSELADLIDALKHQDGGTPRADAG